ncbi:unnamed protein product [Durusdinium trenchii]|uniref:Uncharacterized protein n=1 Tax=Durusdinium trenchii TaxID=1381693 RepID=A0ABP0IUW2_9DINO
MAEPMDEADEAATFVTIMPDGGGATDPMPGVPDGGTELDALLEEVTPKQPKPKYSKALSSVGGQTQKMVQERAQEQINEMQLSCSASGINQRSAKELQLLRGEVEFSGLGTGGHRAHYVIAPPEMESANELLRWMFVRQDGWRLKPPNLLLSCYGGRDHYVNWANSPTLRNREAWATATGAIEDWQFRQKFTSRLSEISSGVCQAVSECGGWFDLGTGPRGGLNEVLMDGLKVYWSAFGCLAGHKTDNVVFCVRFLQDTEFKDSFLQCAQAVPASGPVDKKEELKERVMYPSVNSQLFPELGSDPKANDQDLRGLDPDEEDAGKSAKSVADLELEVRAQITRRFLCNALTHIIFVQSQQTLDRLRIKLRSLATRASIFANGNEALIQPGVDGKILMEAVTGVPIVCLHNTGGAAEMLGAAVLRRRQPQHAEHSKFMYGYELPENVPDDQFLILNPAKDSVEKVINKLTLVLSTVQGSNSSRHFLSSFSANQL